MRIDVEEVRKLKARLSEIRNIDIKDAQFYYEDKLITVDQTDIDEWHWVGLGTDFFVEHMIEEKYIKKNTEHEASGEAGELSTR